VRDKRTSKFFFSFFCFGEREVINSELGTIKSRRRKQVTYYYYTDDDEYMGEDSFIGHGINPSLYLPPSLYSFFLENTQSLQLSTSH